MGTPTQAAGGDASVYRPRYAVIADKIIEFIIASQFKPGDRLPTEQRLGEQLGVSRTVVREALKFLTATGLVGVRKGVGVYVAGNPQHTTRMALQSSMMVDPDNVQALFEFRAMQEALTVRAAIQHMTMAEMRNLEQIVQANVQHAREEDIDRFIETDNAFHQAIAAATHNPFLLATIDNVIQLQRWVVKLITGGYPGSVPTSAEDHLAIFNAIRAGDADAAEQAVRTHIESVWMSYRQEAKRRLLLDHEEDHSA
jgi:GntR family transcriptional regulator, transcriptional repressor for pyruvate dehydrogenase complex